MLLDNINNYRIQLTKLWSSVFGDDEDYIELIFEQCDYDDLKIFAIKEGLDIVSALYAFKVKIDDFSGYYIYACATYDQYRGRGFMSCLLKECISEAKDEKLSFVSLVPGENSLYDYYSRFGFSPLMYRKHLFAGKTENITVGFNDISISDFLSFKESTSQCSQNWDKVYSNYLESCFSYYGISAYSTKDYIFILDSDRFIVIDIILKNKSVSCQQVVNEICTFIKKEKLTVFSDCFGKKEKNGMIYTISDNVIFDDIYMNIALD